MTTLNKQYIQARIEAIIRDNKDNIMKEADSLHEYITRVNDPDWFHEFLDDSKGEVTEENIATVEKMIKANEYVIEGE